MQELLNNLRELRNFDPEQYVRKKTTLLNSFLDAHKINCVILGISGGVDSAVVLGLLLEYKYRTQSDLKIVPYIAPISKCDGVTGQEEAREEAYKLCRFFDIEPVLVDLGEVFQAYKLPNYNEDSDKVNWADGQLASILRTPLAYYLAAIKQTQGYNSIVLGTTNKSEGSYVGFFGKASDGMNDLQLISDIYKSEVLQLADYVQVPDSIIKRTPKGDVVGGLSDEELMGVSYDQLELFLLIKEFGFMENVSFLNEDNSTIFKQIESLHKKNKHKYHILGDKMYPLGFAKHLDVYERGLPI